MPWFAFVLAVTLAARMYQPTGWLGSDDAAYYSAAEHILTGTPITRAHHHYARMAVVLPVAASVAVFGHHTWAVALPTFIASVLCVILVVMLGKELFGWREGLLAGLTVSVLPYFRVLSTTAYPDTHVCLWATAAVLLCVRGLRYTRAHSSVSLVGKGGGGHVDHKDGGEPPVAGAAGSDSLHPAPLPRGEGARRLGGSLALPLAVAGAPGSGWYFVASGIALGLAISSKVFAATTAFALVFLMAQAFGRRWQRTLSCGGLILAGWVFFFLVEGTFFAYWAGDFLFALHAHEQSQSGVAEMAGEGAALASSFAAAVHERMSLMLQTTSSGWGLFGIAFWPVVALGVFHRTARPLAIWAFATYMLIAFFPVSLANGYQPYPHFHGRHILPACVPFALCLALVLGYCLARLERVLADFVPSRAGVLRVLMRSAPGIAAATLIVIASYSNPRELMGFRNRPTSRVGEALRTLAAQDIWQGDKPIFLTPSTYWRYRIMFPDPLRSRLRVAVADGSPDWWRDVAPGIEDRWSPLPWPGKAYLVATPLQLEGRTETWDYGVALPEDPLAFWRNAVWLGVRRDREFASTNAPWSLSGSFIDAIAVGVTIPDIPLHDGRCSCTKDSPNLTAAHLLRDGVN